LILSIFKKEPAANFPEYPWEAFHGGCVIFIFQTSESEKGTKSDKCEKAAVSFSSLTDFSMFSI